MIFGCINSKNCIGSDINWFSKFKILCNRFLHELVAKYLERMIK